MTSIAVPKQIQDAALTESATLAEFALNLDLAQVPQAVRTLAKEHFLDALGIALASTRFDFGRAILQGTRELGQGAQATAIGSGERLPATSAALVNGVLAHGLDFDDTHIGAIYHATAPALAAVLAAGEAGGASGAEVLTAFIAALEIGCRLATVGAGDFHDRAFHPTSLCGTFAAAAAAGRLQKADQQALVWALGLCGSQAAGILERGTSWLKRLHPGWAAHCGLSAVALARAGFSGPDTVLEGRRGFYASHIQRIPEGDALPTAQLGQAWQTLGIALKPYPCCHFIHAFVDAALELRGQFALEDIERIDCLLSAGLHKMVAEPRARCIRPVTPYQALFSVQYVVSVALVRGRVDLATFYDEALDAPEVLAVADKAYCLPDPASDYPVHFPGEVIVHLKDGRRYACRKATSLGTPETPLSRAAIEEKFMKNATRAIPAEQARALMAQVLDIENQASLAGIMALCRVQE
ncbi:MmgE/PrpD family protein [Candidimonas humi]|uniref:MmgE/PrpD family protein n=1 Tax=Candidimonas humi TaxID=683355 RepID=A0ABV8NVD3_9BURK|nr:MmgE/PrpD family protein [Candidimonas humi]MBV6303331.1 MmgE/PrpD family protein [Candidimonas humi]